MAITCSCATDLASVTNEPCSATPYGNQIVKMFLQKMTGVGFDGTVGNDITVEADWDTKIGASGDDKIMIIPNIAGAVKESVEPNIEEGNDVPYDGADLIDRQHTITFDLKYLTDASFAEIDQLSCPVKYRLFYLDNESYLWGGSLEVAGAADGVENVSVVMSSYGQAGIGTKNKFAGNMVRWNSLESVKPVGQLSFLGTK